MFDNTQDKIYSHFKSVNDSKSKEDKLNKRYESKPYHEKYFLLYIGIMIFSVIINVASAFTGGYIIFDLFSSILPNFFLSVSITIVLMASWELMKRVSLSTVFKNYFTYRVISSLAILSAILVIGSALLSLFGSKEGINDLTYAPTLVNTDSLKISFDNDIAYWKGQVNFYQNQKNNEGITYLKYSNDIERATNKIDSLEIKKEAALHNANYINNNSEFVERRKVNAKGWQVAIIVFLFDLSLIFCMGYKENYLFRSFVSMRFKTVDDYHKWLIENGYDLDGNGLIDDEEEKKYRADAGNGKPLHYNGKSAKVGK